MPEPNIPTNGAQQAAEAKATAKKASREKFERVWVRIRDELVEHARSDSLPEDAVKWYTNVLDVNVPGGKLNRGLSVVDTVAIIKQRELTDDEYFKAAILGWIVELLQAFFLVADDIMDQSVTRRGQPCWYRHEGVGNIAINDSFLLEAAIYYLLKTHFRSEPYYLHLLELMLEVTKKTEFGQLVDLITAPEDNVDLNRFSLERHRAIVIYKTAYYSFYLPVALAMHMCGVPMKQEPSFPLSRSFSGETPAADADPYQLALDILIPLGEYFQVQDDWLDYSGTPEQIGKVGTDIIDNKCSWCVNVALARATTEQRALLDAHYGRKDAASEARVKQLYAEMKLEDTYENYEANAVKGIMTLVDSIPAEGRPDGVRREVFTSFLGKIYKRTM